MERTGILIDGARLARQSHEIGQKIMALETQAHELAGQPFNLASPKQLGEILFGKLGPLVTIDDQREFIACKTRQFNAAQVGMLVGKGVGTSHQVAQLVRHVDEQLVACLMAERVVDKLEAIKVDEDERAQGPGRAAPSQEPDVLAHVGQAEFAVAMRTLEVAESIEFHSLPGSQPE